jgi:hypothetical protein
MQSAEEIAVQETRQDTDLKPQSSHSKTGFHPSLLLHMSHFVTKSPLEKNKSNGFHPVATSPVLPLGVIQPLFRFGFAPGLRRVKRCTKGAEQVPLMKRIVDPPPVAHVVEMIEEAAAVW